MATIDDPAELFHSKIKDVGHCDIRCRTIAPQNRMEPGRDPAAMGVKAPKPVLPDARARPRRSPALPPKTSLR